MIRYKTVSVTIPANGEESETILAVPAGEKITLRAIGFTNISGVQIHMDIDNNRFLDVPGDFTLGYGNFLTLSNEVEGPVNISVGGKDSTGGNEIINFSLCYEE